MSESIAAKLTEMLAAPSRVLIVDDHESWASIMRQICDAVGMETVVAKTGEDALKVYRSMTELFSPSRQHRNPYDLVFLDAVLPGISGQEVAKEMRRMWPDQVIILMTGYSLDYDPDLGLIGLWFKGSSNSDRIYSDVRRLCTTLGIPVESTPL